MISKAQKSSLETLNACISSTSKLFSHYQVLPNAIIDRFARQITSDYSPEQLSLDAARLSFLTQNHDVENSLVHEFGSNLGYFCLSLAQDFHCTVNGFEPIEEYARAANAMAQLLDLDSVANFEGRGVLLSDIDKIPECDLLIELNVLHHAGAVFDIAEASGCWDQYAIERLSRMRARAKTLFFQTGNMCKGEALFSSVDVVSHMVEILSKAGWTIKVVGMISDLTASTLNYDHFSIANMSDIPTYHCRRNPETGLVDYHAPLGDCHASLLTGLANRPLWVCE